LVDGDDGYWQGQPRFLDFSSLDSFMNYPVTPFSNHKKRKENYSPCQMEVETDTLSKCIAFTDPIEQVCTTSSYENQPFKNFVKKSIMKTINKESISSFKHHTGDFNSKEHRRTVLKQINSQTILDHRSSMNNFVNLNTKSNFRENTSHDNKSKDLIIQTLNPQEDHVNLVGDFTGSLSLPVVEGRHKDLKCISPETVSGFHIQTFIVIEVKGKQ